jgi:uncharacterized protein YkwD
MKKFGFLSCILALTTCVAGQANEARIADSVQVASATVMPQMEQNVFNMINQNRQNNGLPALIWNNAAATQARNHSVNMANQTVPFGHQGFDMRFATLQRLIPGLTSMGENVAWNQGYRRPGAVAVQSWMNSPGHYANIMGNYNLTGVGVAKDAQGKHYFTQIFVKTSSASIAEEDEEVFGEPQHAISESPQCVQE